MSDEQDERAFRIFMGASTALFAVIVLMAGCCVAKCHSHYHSQHAYPKKHYHFGGMEAERTNY